jgi:hypothetical protein
VENDEVHKKRTCLITTCKDLAQGMTLKCTEECRRKRIHVPLAGGWRGRPLTSWAEDYPEEMARKLCDQMKLLKGPESEQVWAALEENQLEGLTETLDHLAVGSYQGQDLTSMERHELEAISGLKVDSVQVIEIDGNLNQFPNSPEVGQDKYRSVLIRSKGQWQDLEGTVRMTAPRACQRIPETMQVEKAVLIYGRPLYRIGHREFPEDSKTLEIQKWLKKLHVGTAHASPTEMAQAVRPVTVAMVRALARMVEKQPPQSHDDLVTIRVALLAKHMRALAPTAFRPIAVQPVC